MNKLTKLTSALATIMVLMSCGQQTEVQKPTDKVAPVVATAVKDSLIKPIDAPEIKEPAKVELGKKTVV